MIPIRNIAGKDFSKLSSSESVGAAVKAMEKKGVDYLLIEEEGEIEGIVTSRELVGYPSSRLILDCSIQPVGTISEEALADEALRVLEGEQVSFLAVLDANGVPFGIINRQIIIDSLFQELEKLNKEKDKYITKLKRTEEELRISKASFHNIVERSAEGIIIVDRNGIVRFINPTMEIIFGRKAEELLGELFGFPVTEGESTEIDIVRHGGEPGIGEMRAVGTEWEGEPAYLAMIRDITELKRAEEVLRFTAQEWRTTFDAINDAVCLLDIEGKIQRCNKAVTNLLGKPFNEIINNHTCYELMHGTSEPIEGCPMVRMRETHRRETLIFQMNDRWFHAAADPLLDDAGNLIGAVHIMSDITERRKIDQMKSDFVSLVSHQLKTPVAMIKGYIENMLMGLTGDLTDKQRQYLQEMQEISSKNYCLISDLLNVSRIERGVITVCMQPVKLIEIVNLVVQDYRESIQKRGLVLDLEEVNDQIVVLADKKKWLRH